MIRWRPVLAAVYVVALVLVLLLPVGWGLNRLSVRLYVLWTYRLRLPGHPLPETFGTALNVVLFVPLGVLVAVLTRWSWWRVGLAGMVVSALVEASQALPALHREPSVGDVVTNTVGALVGALVVEVVRRRVPRDA